MDQGSLLNASARLVEEETVQVSSLWKPAVIDVARPKPQVQASARPAIGVRCRQIGAADLGAVTDLLTLGFPQRTRTYWMLGLRHLRDRTCPEGYPRYGYILEHEHRVVGVLLLIFSVHPGGVAETLRCNVSSWYVMPEYRNLAPLLVLQGLRHRQATFINTSPAAHTLATIEAQGFQRFCHGVFVAAPALTTRAWGGKVIRVADAAYPQDLLPPSELTLLRDHDAFGCSSMILEVRGNWYPIVVRRRLIKHRFKRAWLPCAQLIYARDVESVVRCSGLIGRHLARRGMPLMLIGANQPISDLPGRFYDDKSPMYFRGPNKPRLGDLAYTEDAIFGVLS